MERVASEVAWVQGKISARSGDGIDRAIASLARAAMSNRCLGVDISTRRCAPTRLSRVYVDGPVAAKLLFQESEEFTP